MRAGALRLYGEGLAAGILEHDAIMVRFEDGTGIPLSLTRYLSPADETDETVLSRAVGPVLDVGCGPGRHLHALARRGVFALGVDLSSVAVDLARGSGARAIVGSIFDELPGAGMWRTALLLDGNVGIAGAPVRLLQRVASLLTDSGQLLVELDPPGTPMGHPRARLETDSATSDWFSWARVSFERADDIAASAGLVTRERWWHRGRWFVRLADERGTRARSGAPSQSITERRAGQ